MFYSRSFAFIGLVLSAPAIAFVTPSSVASHSHSSLGATRDINAERATSSDAIRNFVAASTLALGLLIPSTDALAAQGTFTPLPSHDHALHSSTVELSVEYKTMDFSMPSSYDSIADPVASGTEELSTSTVINTAASKKKTKPASSKSTPSKSDPSSGLSSKEAAAAARAERVAQREADEAAQAVRSAEAAKELEARIKAARLEKIAAREAARDEKEAAAAAEKEDAKFKGAKIMDTSMPSY